MRKLKAKDRIKLKVLMSYAFYRIVTYQRLVLRRLDLSCGGCGQKKTFARCYRNLIICYHIKKKQL